MKNMKVSLKLITSFLIVIVLSVVVAVVGIFGMSTLEKSDTQLYEMNLLSIDALGGLREAYQQQRVALRTFLLVADDPAAIETVMANMTAAEKLYDENMAQYLLTIEDPAEEEGFFTAKSVYENEFAQLKQRVISAVQDGSADSAFADIMAAAATVAPIEKGFTESADKNDEWAMNKSADNTAMFKLLTFVEIGVVAVAAIASMLLALYISGLIAKPMRSLEVLMNQMGTTGDLNIEPALRDQLDKAALAKDEIGKSIVASRSLIMHITNVSQVLETIAEGDLSGEVVALSPKDTLGNSIMKMQDNLNNLLTEINNATSQVATASRQISDGAQALAQGSTEQAASVQELSSSISDIADSTRDNAGLAAKAADLSGTIRSNAQKGSSQMDEMMQAVRDINEASKNINSVIKVIDDIAFQTNILALNAAVEAAHAGEHGKGFAVVAEEVRSLAAKSVEAAKDTSNLISNSMEKADLGARIADETAASLSEIVTGINESTSLINDIARASEEQSSAIKQINIGIDQVAQVVQQNSATSQESAAASEEMNSQSETLNMLVAQFKLREGDYASSSLEAASSGMRKPMAIPSRVHSDDGFGKY